MDEQIIAKFLANRESLSQVEANLLIQAIQDDPELAVTLKDHLITDDLMSRFLAVDRRGFALQVTKRIDVLGYSVPVRMKFVTAGRSGNHSHVEEKAGYGH